MEAGTFVIPSVGAPFSVVRIKILGSLFHFALGE